MTTAEDNFLPEGYEPPKSSSKYTKFEDGKTVRIRALSSPILGWEYWNKQDKDKGAPVRLPYTKEAYAEAVKEANKNAKKDDKKVNHFWAFIVWNYDSEKIEVCQITQKTIQTAIREQSLDEEYGNPKNWDIKITKTKEGDRTTYGVSPGVPKPVSKEIQEEYDKGEVNLRALFYGEDPFDTDWIEPVRDDAT